MMSEFDVPEDHPIYGFASLGAQGRAASSSERDLHRWLRDAFGLQVRPTIVKLPVANPSGPGTIEIDQPVIMPVDLAGAMWDAGTTLFHKRMVGKLGLAGIAEFWKHAMRMEWAEQHPHTQDPGKLPTAIPIWIHGDVARVYNSQKLLIISWMSALVTGCSWSSRYLFTVLPHDLIQKTITLDSLLRHFADSINGLQSGKRTTGGSICGPFRFIYAGSKGDLEWHWMAYSLKRYYRCNWLCSRCFASKTCSDMLWTNLREDAPWRATTIRTTHFLENAAHLGHTPGLCRIQGWSADTMIWDLMHNLFIGPGRDLCGNVLARLIQQQWYCTSPEVDDHLKALPQLLFR